jgi:uncharacterized membrane protein
MGTATHYLEINAPAQRCYDWWRPLTHLPDIMPDVKEVESRPPEADRTHWKVAGPAGTTFEWDARIVEDEAGRKIAWKSVDSEDGGKATIPNGGAVRFDDHGDTTGVEVSLHFEPPGGRAGEALASLFADPQQKVQRGLESFKHVMENGLDRSEAGATWQDPGPARG